MIMMMMIINNMRWNKSKVKNKNQKMSKKVENKKKEKKNEEKSFNFIFNFLKKIFVDTRKFLFNALEADSHLSFFFTVKLENNLK